MNEHPVRLTPLVLLLAVISICMTVLGILTYTTARADMNLAETYAQTIRSRYELEKAGETKLHDLFSSPAAVSSLDADEDGVHREELDNGAGLVLRIGIRPAEDGTPVVVEWRFEHGWTEDTSIESLWDGKVPG